MEKKSVDENTDIILVLLGQAIEDVEQLNHLINHMDNIGYFTSPASTKYHGVYKGGLAQHSLNVYLLFKNKISEFKLEEQIPSKSVIICSLLHDMCKCGLYLPGYNDDFKYNIQHPRGHALLSIEIIEKFITLTDLEKEIIKYHMGYYGTTELKGAMAGEYSLAELRIANNNPITKLFHWCDDMESQFIK